MYRNDSCRQKCLAGIIAALFTLTSGCQKPLHKPETQKELVTDADLGTTIGSLVEAFFPEYIPVKGYGVVAGLPGTGSVECPPEIRAYLEQYILKELPDRKMDINAFIDSYDTAVVVVEAMMPTTASKNDTFDIVVTALAGTQTTSLENGWLYGVELKVAGGLSTTMRVLAVAAGPVFIDKIGRQTNKKTGYILAGGTVLSEFKVNLAIRQPDYQTASFVSNRLNEKFGRDTAKAVSASQIVLEVPARYQRYRKRFVAVAAATYLNESPQITQTRINNFVRRLAVAEEKYHSEIVLEAIGNACLGKLSALLNSSNEEVRLRAGRCALNMGSFDGLKVLRQMAFDTNSAYRLEAIEAITAGAARNDAAAIVRRLLRDEDFDIRIAAYEQLRKLDDITVSGDLIADSFYIEQIVQTPHKGIYVSRSSQPRIVLFGAPIYCRDGIFVQSADGNITINAAAGTEYVSIIRKHPTRPQVIIELKSSFDLADIVRTLCREPMKQTDRGRAGLNVSYSDTIELLMQLSEKAAVAAEFRAGPLPKIGPIVKK